jgi:hypothetical protein
MALTPFDFIIPIISGSMIIFIIIVIGYGVYYMLNKIGLFKIFKILFKPKISDDIYEFVADRISKGEKLNDITQYSTRFPLKTQEKYINAYFELTELNTKQNLKG